MLSPTFFFGNSPTIALPDHQPLSENHLSTCLRLFSANSTLKEVSETKSSRITYPTHILYSYNINTLAFDGQEQETKHYYTYESPYIERLHSLKRKSLWTRNNNDLMVICSPFLNDFRTLFIYGGTTAIGLYAFALCNIWNQQNKLGSTTLYGGNMTDENDNN